MANMIERTKVTPAAWVQALTASKDQKKDLADWVKSQYSKEEQKTGFMREGYFYRPLYTIHKDGQTLDYLLDAHTAKLLYKAWNRFGRRKAARLNPKLYAFIAVNSKGSYGA